MKTHHWIALVVVFAVGYFVGIKWPGTGNSIIGAVPSVSL